MILMSIFIEQKLASEIYLDEIIDEFTSLVPIKRRLEQYEIWYFNEYLYITHSVRLQYILSYISPDVHYNVQSRIYLVQITRIK